MIVWDVLLRNVFADDVSGIDAVLDDGDHAFTYTIVNGVAIAKYVTVSLRIINICRTPLCFVYSLIACFLFLVVLFVQQR